MSCNGNYLAQQDQDTFFVSQFTPKIEPSNTWLYMGTIQAPNSPGYIVDAYHNFISGRYEHRNPRQGEVK
jgi:hypothetical protein